MTPTTLIPAAPALPGELDGLPASLGGALPVDPDLGSDSGLAGRAPAPGQLPATEVARLRSHGLGFAAADPSYYLG